MVTSRTVNILVNNLGKQVEIGFVTQIQYRAGTFEQVGIDLLFIIFTVYGVLLLNLVYYY